MEKEELSKQKLDYIKGWCELIISLNNKKNLSLMNFLVSGYKVEAL